MVYDIKNVKRSSIKKNSRSTLKVSVISTFKFYQVLEKLVKTCSVRQDPYTFLGLEPDGCRYYGSVRLCL